jgi:hypothetical protein
MMRLTRGFMLSNVTLRLGCLLHIPEVVPSRSLPEGKSG